MGRKKRDSFEVLLYKCIGVLLVKKIVLRVEEILHVKRGYRLMNYHPEKMTAEGFRNFYWQLIYNCTLHIASIVLSLLYFVMAFISNVQIAPLNIAVWVLIIFNLYCIFLQRYTYLRMWETVAMIEKNLNYQYESKIKKIDKNEPVFMSKEIHKKSLELIDRVERVFLRECSCFIGDGDLNVLEQMEKTFREFDIKFRTISGGELFDVVSIEGGIELINPNKRANVVVNALKNMFYKNRYLSEKKCIVLVTESDRCEDLYNAIFGNDSTEIELLKIKLFKYIYANKVQVE